MRKFWLHQMPEDPFQEGRIERTTLPRSCSNCGVPDKLFVPQRSQSLSRRPCGDSAIFTSGPSATPRLLRTYELTKAEARESWTARSLQEREAGFVLPTALRTRRIRAPCGIDVKTGTRKNTKPYKMRIGRHTKPYKTRRSIEGKKPTQE